MLAILHPLPSIFAAPAWLFLLLPWCVLAIWLLIGQRDRVAVPFLPLWNNTLGAPKTKRSFRAPPLAIVLLLLAILFGIFGAAGPQRRSTIGPVPVLVDRGITMSADDRLRDGLRMVRSHFPSIETIPIPAGSADRPVAMDTGDLLNAAIVEHSKDSALAVVSDQAVERPWITVMPGPRPINNVGIVSVSARSSPRAQAMVRVRNQSDLKTASVTIRSGDATQTQQIQLPPRDGEQNYFIDLPSLADVVEVKMQAGDELPIDNVAWLVRRQAWPKIEAIDPLPAEVGRMVDVYQKNRPPAGNSTRVVVANDAAHLPAGAPGIAIMNGGSAAPVAPKELAIVPHELTRDIDWNALAPSAVTTHVPVGDWTPLVRAGDRVLLAIREQPHQAFVALDTTSAARSAQFVVLFGKLFDWAGQGGDVYATDPVHNLGDEWKLIATDPSAERYDPPLPGVYRRSDGALLAMSAIDVRFPRFPGSSRRDVIILTPVHVTSFRAPILGIAILSTLGALALVKPRKRASRTPQFPDV